MGRPRKEIDQPTLEDFIQYYNLKQHDWIADVKMNRYVNAALGIDIFSTAAWPISFAYEAGEVYLKTVAKELHWKENSFNYSAAVQFVEEALHDSERS